MTKMEQVLYFIFYILSFYSVGRIISKLFKIPMEEISEEILISEGLGSGVISFLFLFFGYIGVIDKTFYISLLIIFSLTGFLFLIKDKQSLKTVLGYKADRTYRLFILIFSIVTFFHLISCFIPVTDTDSLYYHLTIPKKFIKVGKIHNVTLFFKYATFPQIGEMLYMSAMVVNNEILTNFVHFLFCVLTAVLIYVIGKRCYNEQAGMVGAVVFVSLPVVRELVGTAKIDLILTFYVFLAGYSIFRFIETQNKRWFYLSAVYSGFAFGTKYTGIFSLLSLPLMFFVYRFKHLGLNLRNLILFFLIFMLTISPWLIRNYIYTRNPVSPFLYKIFNGTNWNDYLQKDLENHFKACKLPILKYFKDFIGENGDIFMLSFLILIFGHLQVSTLKYFIFLGLTNFLLSLLFLPSIIRFLLPSLGILSLVCGVAIVKIMERNFKIKWLGTILLLYVVISIGYKIWLPISKILFDNNWKVIFGMESKQEFLKRKINVYDIIEYVNRNASANEKIISLNDPCGFYFEPDFIVSYHCKVGSLLHVSRDIQKIVRYLKGNNVKWLFLNLSSYYRERIRDTILLNEENVEKYLCLEYKTLNGCVYKIK